MQLNLELLKTQAELYQLREVMGQMSLTEEWKDATVVI